MFADNIYVFGPSVRWLQSSLYLMCVRLMQNRMELFSTATKKCV